jgi:holo-[acyl-carrier protein] synthase
VNPASSHGQGDPTAGESARPDTSAPEGDRPHVVIGVDLLERARLLRTYARFGERFLRRVFTPTELAEAGWRVERLMGRFAAKEACAKALGTGMVSVAWREIEVRRLPGGKPALRLHGRAAERAAALGLLAFDVSISDTATQTMAVVVGVGSP